VSGGRINFSYISVLVDGLMVECACVRANWETSVMTTVSVLLVSFNFNELHFCALYV
jgi:hypothetical protein